MCRRQDFHFLSYSSPVPFPVIPHVAPPVWPDLRPGRFAAAIYKNSTELLDSPSALRAVAAKCRIGLIGLTDDTGIELNHGRPGAREGPHAFRRALSRYGVATPINLPRPYPHVFDAGDIIVGQDIHETHDRITAAVEAIVDLGLIPVGIGGGHDLTYPLVRGVARARKSGPMTGAYMDAHLDVRAEVGSGMAFRRLLEEGIVSRLGCFGLNRLVNSTEHFEWFRSHGGEVGRLEPGYGLPGGASREPPPAGTFQFFSLDLDVLDSAVAPGVSAPHPCGMSAEDVRIYVHAAGRNPAVVCFDIMELSPRHDEGGRTARLAAHMFLEFLQGFTWRPETAA